MCMPKGPCGSGFCMARNLAMALCFSSTAASVWLGTNSTMPLSVPVAITLYGVRRRSRLSLRPHAHPTQLSTFPPIMVKSDHR